jgi:hypothetical protein
VLRGNSIGILLQHPHLAADKRSPIVATLNKKQSVAREEMKMRGAAFQPELIELMKSILDDVTLTLPEAERTSAMKAQIASHILACAAKGEHSAAALRAAALLTVVEGVHYSHDISPERRVVHDGR